MNIIPKINGDFKIYTNSLLHITGINIKDPFHLLDDNTLALLNKKFDGINKTNVMILVTKRNDYQIKIINGNIIIETNKELVYNAITTLFQLKNELFKNMVLFDYPKYQHREFSIDVARHYFSIDELKKILDEAANLKLNKIHLHLSDNQGYRVESQKFPLLNEIGGQNGYYTKAQLKDLIDFANARHIEIIPEIDIPGHVGAILASYPDLGCKEKQIALDNGYKKNDKTLCFGNNKTIYFVKELFNEITEIFPSNYIHIGCDEIDLSHNKTCPKCKEFMKNNGYKNFNEVITNFINEIANHLFKLNKQVIVWNDATRYGKLDERIVIQNWFDYPLDKTTIKEFNNNRRFIFGSTYNTYFDYPTSLITTKKVYDFNPNINNQILTGNNILGISSHIWTEIIDNNQKLEEMTFPRLISFAENAWTLNKDYSDFLNRLKIYLNELKLQNINFTDIKEYTRQDEINDIVMHFKKFLNDDNHHFSVYQTLTGAKLVLKLLHESNHIKDIPEIALKLIKKEP